MISIRRHTASEPWTYALKLAEQARIAETIRADHAPGALLLSEVAPVITLGRSTQEGDVWASDPELARHGIERLAVARGGRATYHGPGQWVLFPVARLDFLTGDSRGVRLATEGLLQIARRTAAAFSLDSECRGEDEVGVWTKDGRKLASVGIQVRERVLLHGLSFNVHPTEESFFGLHPCGLQVKPGYLFADAQEGRARFDEVSEELLRATHEVFPDWARSLVG